MRKLQSMKRVADNEISATWTTARECLQCKNALEQEAKKRERTKKKKNELHCLIWNRLSSLRSTFARHITNFYFAPALLNFLSLALSSWAVLCSIFGVAFRSFFFLFVVHTPQFCALYFIYKLKSSGSG